MLRKKDKWLLNSNLDYIGTRLDKINDSFKNSMFKFYEIEKQRQKLAQKRLDFDKKTQNMINISKEEYLDLLRQSMELKLYKERELNK